jgi:hypothetical protein
MRAIRLFAMGSVLVGAALSPGQMTATQPQIVEGTRTQTARGGGFWRSWVNASGAQVLCADANALWFAKSGTVWRYNVPMRQVDLCTSPLTHPELRWFGRGCISRDGRFAVSSWSAILLWDGKAVAELPPVPAPLRRSKRPDGGSLRDFFGGTEARQVAVLRVLGNSLLERMHPPMAPSVRYVVEPGMDYEHARAVFAAAGAAYSSDIHNAHHGDLSYQGYLLPDNTMVYLRVENTYGTGKVVSIGLGEAGKGLDRNWDWGDEKKNSLKNLELKPYRTRMPD